MESDTTGNSLIHLFVKRINHFERRYNIANSVYNRLRVVLQDSQVPRSHSSTCVVHGSSNSPVKTSHSSNLNLCSIHYVMFCLSRLWNVDFRGIEASFC